MSERFVGRAKKVAITETVSASDLPRGRCVRRARANPANWVTRSRCENARQLWVSRKRPDGISGARAARVACDGRMLEPPSRE